MNDYLKYLKKKIEKNLKIEKINIVDNSIKHKSHKFFDSNKYHLLLEIQSSDLSNLKKIEAQRRIYKILKDDLNSKIHALELKIR